MGTAPFPPGSPARAINSTKIFPGWVAGIYKGDVTAEIRRSFKTFPQRAFVTMDEKNLRASWLSKYFGQKARNRDGNRMNTFYDG